MKILIAVPCMDQVPAQFCQSLAMLKKVGECAVSFQVGSLIYTSRDALAKRAISMDASYVLWLDSDMVFEPDLLIRMVDRAAENTIITGLYFRRSAPFTPVLFDKLEMTDKGCEWTEFKELPAEPFEVGGCGFGCVLSPVDAFMAVTLNFREMFNPMKGVGEDLAFCWRARQSGYKIICDPSIECGHVGHTVINREFFEAYRRSTNNDAG